MQKFLEHLQEAEKTIQTTDHLIYVTFPLIKDKRILLKAITGAKSSIAHCINAILQYEYLYKRIKLYKDARTNLQTFREKCARRYNITSNEISLINELFEVVKNHEQSPFEFLKNEKVVILSENMQQRTITLEKIKEFLNLTKEILRKTKSRILQ